MKATDLMIGDLVRLKDNKKIIPVEELLNFNSGCFTHQGINGSWECGACIGWYDYDDIEPIPLTKAIMFANGFESNGCKGVLVHKTDKDLKVYYEIDHFAGDNNDWVVKEWSVVGIAGIEFVHEYQHYLRLVGKSDFADNFKVK